MNVKKATRELLRLTAAHLANAPISVQLRQSELQSAMAKSSWANMRPSRPPVLRILSNGKRRASASHSQSLRRNTQEEVAPWWVAKNRTWERSNYVKRHAEQPNSAPRMGCSLASATQLQDLLSACAQEQSVCSRRSYILQFYSRYQPCSTLACHPALMQPSCLVASSCNANLHVYCVPRLHASTQTQTHVHISQALAPGCLRIAWPLGELAHW